MSKPIVLSEENLLKELTAIAQEYKRMIADLNSHYQVLSKLRDQFPLRFLKSDSIKSFLIENNKLNENEIKKLKRDQEKLNSLLTKTKQDKNNDDLENKIKDIQVQLKIKNTNISYYNKMLKSVDKNSVDYFYEDLLLFASNCKHEAIDLWKNSYAVYEDLKINEEYFIGQFLIEVSEDALKDKGFMKISADIRKAYLNSKKELKQLKQLTAKAQTLKDTSKELLNCFNADEVNLRRFVDRHNNIHGL